MFLSKRHLQEDNKGVYCISSGILFHSMRDEKKHYSTLVYRSNFVIYNARFLLQKEGQN
jgi:hypothetical protein